MFDVRHYIKVFVLYNILAMPFSISLPAIDIINSTSLEQVTNEGERYASLVTAGYTVREVDTQGGSGKVIQERPGTNQAVGWDWYVDKLGRSKVLQ
jgi:hypothetical protein